jgi:putative ABC transport system ATP-binding protein
MGRAETMLSVGQLSKTYFKGDTSVRALKDVTFEVREGDFLAIVGRSGSGKSTLLNLIGGLDTPTSGRIMFGGKDLASMKRSELADHRRHSVGMVFQSFNLVPYRTALENVALALVFGRLARRRRTARASALLEQVGLGDRAEHRPAELSGGEAQRVAIARALANQPDMLLLDEPTGNLDSRTAREIMEIVCDLNRTQGLTVLMVTHEEEIALEVSTSLIRLLDGRIVDRTGGGQGR